MIDGSREAHIGFGWLERSELDDVEIEVVKLFVCIREQIDITEPFVFAGLKTSLLGGTSVVFTCVEDDKSRDKDYPLQNIQSTIAKIRPLRYDQGRC